MPTSLIAPLVTAGVNYGASKLFGGGSSGNYADTLRGFQPAGLNAGGLSTSLDGGNINVTPSAERLAAVGNIASAYGAQANELRALRNLVSPGVSALRDARLSALDSAREKAIGDLRTNLQSRRVLGSSFGQDTLARADAEFASRRSDAEAAAFLQEIDASSSLLDRETAAHRTAFQTGLDELNLEANLAAQLSGKATDAMASSSRTLAALQAQDDLYRGKFFGQMFEPAAKAIGGSAGRFFGNLNFGGGSGGYSLTPSGFVAGGV